MDYSQLSDFEINKRVAVELGHYIEEEKYGNASVGAFHSDGVVYKSHDYCNNPADAWPIIESNRISIRNRHEGDWKAENEWGESRFHVACNALRAAMIVFLMMQDAKHV
ncbi:phage protein NinX family protein [Enterobacter kobei]|uniref:phage protein NinX family protein n=1 Tax=Enterobacter kobei TaxID=208224 RepID=UPI0032AEE8E1